MIFTEPTFPPLGADEIHIHLFSLLEDETAAEGLAALLSPDELVRARRLVTPLHRARYISSRAALRRLLGGYISRHPREINFRYGALGKPCLDYDTPLVFNLSHSGSLALLAVGSNRRLGVDLEGHDPTLDRDLLARQNFSAWEQAELKSLPQADRLRAFFDIWTRKEALVKALGDGLACPLDAFDVAFLPGQPPAVTHLDVPGERAADWRIFPITIPGAWSAAVATDQSARIIFHSSVV